MESITAQSSRSWILKHPLKLARYLRGAHRKVDRENVMRMLFDECPDEGKKICDYYSVAEQTKKDLLIKFLYFHPQITAGIFGDQRYGKDATLCEIYDEVMAFCLKEGLVFPRVVTLGNIKKPPFVADHDMYYSFKNIPAGQLVPLSNGQKALREVWIYSSEIETSLPSREFASPENRLFSQLEGTMAQNHQKLFGCCKLASKVDLNFIRGMNVKIFKFISPDKLEIGGVERTNVLSPLASWHLPRDPKNKAATLLLFDQQIFNVEYPLPKWWNTNYSEQFREVPMDKVMEFVDCQLSNGLNVSSIQIAVSQKFRVNLNKEQIQAAGGSN